MGGNFSIGETVSTVFTYNLGRNIAPVALTLRHIVHPCLWSTPHSAPVPWSSGYLAYFSALEGYNTWGKIYEEAIKHAEETLTLYLESFDELGKSILEERGLKQPTSLGVTGRIPVIA